MLRAEQHHEEKHLLKMEISGDQMSARTPS